jgi:hypothetical protein
VSFLADTLSRLNYEQAMEMALLLARLMASNPT